MLCLCSGVCHSSCVFVSFFFFKQKTAYEMRISDWSSDVCSSDLVFRRYDVVRMYADPPYWETEIDDWVDEFGEERVIRWHTRRIVQMHAACERLKTDVIKRDGTFRHDGCELTQSHTEHTRAAARPMEIGRAHV